MALVLFLKEQIRGRSVKRVYSRAFSLAKRVLDALGIEVLRIEVAKLRLVRETDLDREELDPDVIELKLDRRFRFREGVDLSGYTWKYSDGYVDFIGRYKGKEVLVHLRFNVGIPKSVRKLWGDIVVDLHGDPLLKSEIEQMLRGLDFVEAWRFD